MRVSSSDYEFFVLPAFAVTKSFGSKQKTRWGFSVYWYKWAVEFGG